MNAIEIVTFRAPGLIPSLAEDMRSGSEPVLLVPQSFTLAAEKAVLNRTAGRGILGLKIFSPRSLVREIFECAGHGGLKPLSADGRVMLLSRLLLQNEEALQYYRRSVRQPGLAERIHAQIEEFRIAGLGPADLEGLAESPATEKKFRDLRLLWEQYDLWRGRGYADEADQWADALRRLPASGVLTGTHLIIYGFDLITGEIAALVRAARPLTEKITIGLICDPDGPDAGVFLSASRSIARFRKTSGLPCVQRFFYTSFTADPGIRWAETALFAVSGCPEPVPDLSALTLYTARTSARECEYIAQTLAGWHQAGVPWSEMGVAVCETEILPHLLPQVLQAAGIPCTVRMAQSVMATDLAVWFRSLMLALRDRWQKDDMLNLFRTGFSALSGDDLMALENLVRARGITRKKWLTPFPGEDETSRRLEAARAELTGSLLALRQALVRRSCTGREAAELLYRYMIDRGVYRRLLEEEDAWLAEEQGEQVDLNRQAWSAILDILNQLAAFAEDVHLSLEDLSSMVIASLSSHQIKSLPQRADSVIVSKPSMFLSDGLRCMAVAGFQQGAAPGDTALLTDRERRRLQARDVNIGYTREELSARMKQDVYQAVSLAREKLLISCATAAPDGSALFPAQAFKALRAAAAARQPERAPGSLRSDGLRPFSPGFALERLAVLLREARDSRSSFLTEDTPENQSWRECLGWLSRDPVWGQKTRAVLAGLSADSRSPGIRPEQAAALYPRSLSPSFAETAGTCLCMNWVQRGLGLRPREEFSFETDRQGIFTHAVLQQYFQEAPRHPDWPRLSREEIGRILNRILRRETASWREGPLGADVVHRYRGASLIRGVRTVCTLLTEAIASGNHFQPYALEAGFGDFGDRRFPPVRMVTPAGREITLSGVVDRIDTLTLPEGDAYFLITDYKSSVKELKASRMAAGLELQLPLYLHAVEQAMPGFRPAGGVYQPVRDWMVEAAPEQAEEALVREARSRGLVLDDARVQAAMQPLKVGTGRGDVLPACSAGEMQRLIREALETTGALTDRQFSGATDPDPLIDGERSPCEYCMLKDACLRDPRLPGGQGHPLPQPSETE